MTCPLCEGDGAEPTCFVNACQADTTNPAVLAVIAAARRKHAPCHVCNGTGEVPE
jgi:DnaJ-class molecular chaperone